MVGRIRRVVKGHWTGGNIFQFDEFVVRILHSGDERVIHHFTDDDGADLRGGIWQPGAHAELRHGRGAVLSERVRRHRREIDPDARVVATEADAILRRAKLHFRAVAGEIAERIGGAQDGAVAVR